MKILVVVDMQNDFLTGPLGTAEACAIIEGIHRKMKTFDGMVLATKDTHQSNYLETQEGKLLPIIHCVKGTSGWAIFRELERSLVTPPIEKRTFGSVELGQLLASYDKIKTITEVQFVGVCTDICVISNALLIKSFLPEAKIVVDASLCAGTTPEKHKAALDLMRGCQIIVENDN